MSGKIKITMEQVGSHSAPIAIELTRAQFRHVDDMLARGSHELEILGKRKYSIAVAKLLDAFEAMSYPS